MGTILDELGYELRPANAVRRSVQQLASTRPMAWLFQRTLFPLDKFVFRRTGGRSSVTGLLAGVPVLLLTTTGAKSGRPRTMPLLGIPVGADLAVIGSNFGQESTPGWVYNLEADPRASVSHRDRSVEVVASRADDERTDEVFRSAAQIYPGYARYRRRADHRTIRVFVLRTAGEQG